MSGAQFKLYYWPLAFRGCFVSYLFAYRNVPLIMETSFEENNRLRALDPKLQETPYMGPPVLKELASHRTISQMPAIVLYVSPDLDLLPVDHFDIAMSMKIIMDCNDVLMELCLYNGSSMWQRDAWIEFRSKRLPRWMTIFEESLSRGIIGKAAVNFSDIGIYALFGNMIRCLPELEPDLAKHAPGILALCQRIGSEPSLARYVLADEEQHGKIYCGGQIEASIRRMLELDSQVH